jgi:hypothetical protein
MLESLHLKNVGPAPQMDIDFAPRLNLITGDNGLGKSFLLDVAWWALTRTWACGLVTPSNPPTTVNPAIAYSYGSASGKRFTRTSVFDPAKEEWQSRQGRPPIPGLVMYAQVDGSFSVWDPARNSWKDDQPARPSAFFVQCTGSLGRKFALRRADPRLGLLAARVLDDF